MNVLGRIEQRGYHDRLAIEGFDELELRLLHPRYAGALHDALQHDREHLMPFEPALAKANLGSTLSNLTRERIQMQAGAALGYLAVPAADPHTVIGNVGLYDYKALEGEGLVYAWLSKSYEGQGLASSMIKTLFSEAQRTLGLRKAKATIAPHNIRSERMFASIGGVLTDKEVSVHSWATAEPTVTRVWEVNI